MRRVYGVCCPVQRIVTTVYYVSRGQEMTSKQKHTRARQFPLRPKSIALPSSRSLAVSQLLPTLLIQHKAPRYSSSWHAQGGL